MVLTTIRFVVPPDKRDTFLRVLRSLLEPTRVERGCLDFGLYQDIQDENTFILIEKWEAVPDLMSHLRTDGFQRVLWVMDLASEAPVIEYHTVQTSEGMELISSARSGESSRNVPRGTE